MSLSELLLVIIVAVILFKPEDVPILFYKLGKVKSWIRNAQNQFSSTMEEDIVGDSEESLEDIKQINFYLEEIVKIKGDYDDDYSLDKLKKYYFKLMKEELKGAVQHNSKILDSNKS